MPNAFWPYLGSRWWKFDFHTHTPASKDTSAWQHAVGTPNEVTPEKWLLKYMAAGIDCLAVTDHNSGAWVDKLKTAYAAMHAQAEQGPEPTGFRKLTLFPGVEISVQGGVHLLAIFSPDATTGDIDSLLGRVGYAGTKGDSDAETSQSLEHVIQAVLDMGAIPIPAHADAPKGLLRVTPGTKQCALSAPMVKQALAVEGLLAVEWNDHASPLPEAVTAQAGTLARVLGSDGHTFQGTATPGSRYTWVKMASPTLEGLRLALLDDDNLSLRRVENGASDPFDPCKTPEHHVAAIEIVDAKVMGHGHPARLACSPFFNAVVGGRGTGKSSVVHALRLATGRSQDLAALGADSEPTRQFAAFCKDALQTQSSVRVEWRHGDQCLRLSWRKVNQQLLVEEWRNGNWVASNSQSVNAARFPVRILSQGQIAALAGSGRKALLAIIDEAAHIETLKQDFDEAKRTFFTQRARLREIQGRLATLPEAQRKFDELTAKLEALSQADHAQVLRDYAKTQRQSRAITALFDQLRGEAAQLTALPEKIVLDDWPAQYFGDEDAELLAWRAELEQKVESVRDRIREQARQFDALISTEAKDARLHALWGRAQTAERAHVALQEQLAQQGVADPQAFARLTQERQQLEAQLKNLQRLQDDQGALEKQIGVQQALLGEKRRAITAARQAFIQATIASNRYVRMVVVPMGSDPEMLERELRDLIDVNDERFSDDILAKEDGAPAKGIAYDLTQVHESTKAAALDQLKQRLLMPDDNLGAAFRKNLNRKHEKPEFGDHILAWFPEDDLRIEYQREHKWQPIHDGSQGQRSAALLAFLLAFGEEPIVLDQPEDDLDNHLIYELIVQQIRENKLRRQLIVVTHNPNVVVNGDAELVHVMEFGRGQCYVKQSGALQDSPVREEVWRVMEGGREAFKKRWKRLEPRV